MFKILAIETPILPSAPPTSSRLETGVVILENISRRYFSFFSDTPSFAIYCLDLIPPRLAIFESSLTTSFLDKEGSFNILSILSLLMKRIIL